MAKMVNNVKYGREKQEGVRGFTQKAFYFPNRLSPIMKEYSILARKKMMAEKNYHKVRADSMIMRRLVISWVKNNTTNSIIKDMANDFLQSEGITIRKTE